MTTADFIREHHACRRGAEWALSISDDMADVWDAMIEQGKLEWLIWTVSRPGVFPDTALRKLACRFVRETPLADGRKVWDLLTDERSRKAVEVAELYADGKATKEELRVADAAVCAAVDVAFAVARAATRDATRAAAYDAAYAAARATCAAAEAAVCAAARDADAAAYAANAAADDAAYAAKEAQVQMIAELGNPFKKERTGR